MKTRMELLQVYFHVSCSLDSLTKVLYKGLVGQLQRKKSDIGFANLFMVPDRMKYIDYTDPYLIEYASFMLSIRSFNCCVLFLLTIYSAKPPNPPQWLRILQPLQTSAWIGIK